jgi:cytochrome c oxidase subunit II
LLTVAGEKARWYASQAFNAYSPIFVVGDFYNLKLLNPHFTYAYQMHRVSKLSFPLRPALLLLVPVAIALLAACTPENNQSTFGTAGPVAKDQAWLFSFIFWIAAVVFILVEGAIVYIAIRYRRRSDSDKLPYQTHGNNRLEITWTIIPIFILAAIAIPTLIGIWEQQADVPRDQGDILSVEAIGHQWWFEFRYPDHEIITANELHIPVGRPVAFKLESQDVIHSFWVPKIAGKVDMVPLNDNYMWMIGDEVGTFYGQCAEFCGIAHAHMRFRVIVHTEEDFLAWAEGMHTAPDAPVAGSPEALGKNLFAANCSSCHTSDSTAPGSYEREISSQQARWNGWISDIENSGIVSAPNLTHFGTRSTLAAGLTDLNQETLEDWIDNPESIKIGTRMQKHAAVYNMKDGDGTANLTADEVSDIATYLLSLKPGSSTAGATVDTGGPVDGAEVFASNCTSCHSTGVDEKVGPGLAEVGGRAGSRVNGLSTDEYLEQSLREPKAFIVDGYPDLMPEWGHLGDDSIDALITYLKTLK